MKSSMSLPPDFDFDDPASVDRFREILAELSARARQLPTEQRHDAGNSVGAARNALELILESRGNPERVRFIEIAIRNMQRAETLISSSGSAGNQRNDLGRSGKGDNGNTLGF
jgi:hypothetical protein